MTLPLGTVGRTAPFLNSMLAADPNVRFVDHHDGTITDTLTGLMWEKKTAHSELAPCDIHCVENQYEWTASGIYPDGTLFTEFLANLNRADGSSSDGTRIDRQNYNDWRIPTSQELQTILLVQEPGTIGTCIDPVFGPTKVSEYWSSTAVGTDPFFAWDCNPFTGSLFGSSKSNRHYARGVRRRR